MSPATDTKGLIWVGEPENLAALLGALRDIDYHLDFVRGDVNHYDQLLVDSATGQYLAAFRQYLPDGKNRTSLGLQAWSAWLLFAKAAASCGNDLTRTCIYDAGRKVHSWNGAGLHAPTDPGANSPVECYTMMRATTKGFVRMPDVARTAGSTTAARRTCTGCRPIRWKPPRLPMSGRASPT